MATRSPTRLTSTGLPARRLSAARLAIRARFMRRPVASSVRYWSRTQRGRGPPGNDVVGSQSARAPRDSGCAPVLAVTNSRTPPPLPTSPGGGKVVRIARIVSPLCSTE
ncbi:MAG: hypothetical protein EBX36_03755 [Planctomycetia bacterium]|nr:hypothetical protein [Planctomycetia bacterium]